jgi:hypothetical protein
MAYKNSSNIDVTGIVGADGVGDFNGRTITGTTDFIDVANGNGVAGNPTMSIATNFKATGMDTWNAAIVQSAAITITSNGTDTVTCAVEQSGGGDLTVVFSDGYYDWDTTPADSVTLTAGTDTAPQLNYVYFLQSTKTLTASTVGWPATEHAPIATIICQSEASVLADEVYKQHNWTDHTLSTNNQGHIAHLNFWIRQQDATYTSGVTQTYTITTNGGAADNVLLTTTAGEVLQLHPHDFPAFTGTPDYYVINDSVTPYTKVTDLNALLTDSTGASMSAKFFSLVLWGVVSEDASTCKLMINLPGGSYNTLTGVQEDLDKFANYTIPTDYKGTGFLISEWKLRHQVTASGTWTSIDEIDLRGLLPAISAGGSQSFPVEYDDSVFRVFDDGDDTKKIAFQADQITTATTRTITMLDADIDLANVVQGPGSATSANLASYNGTTGKLIQDAGIATGDVVEASASLEQYRVIVGNSGAKDVSALGSVGSSGQVLTSNGAGSNPSWATPTVGTVTSVSGTASRISSTGGATPVIDIDAAYVGQASITTLGTITTGTWNGTDIAVADGGTGRSSHTAYAVICGGTTTTAAQQSIASVGTSGQVLTSNGAGALPTFQAAAGGVTGPGSSTDNALARWNGTGGSTLQDSTVLVSDNGEMTNGSQPAFLAYLGTTDSNVTGDATNFVVGSGNALTEVFDQNNDFVTTGTFTAPVTGRYAFFAKVTVSGITSVGSNNILKINTSNRNFETRANNSNPPVLWVDYTIFCDMDASDTATMSILTVDSGGKIDDVVGEAGGTSTWFAGHLVC